MFNTKKFFTRTEQLSKSKRETRALTFNGQRIFISGFTSGETVKTEIFGTAYKVSELPISNNSEIPLYNSISLNPIAIDMVYELSTDSLSIMESNDTELIICSYSDGISPSILSSIKATSILIQCGDYTTPIERVNFNNVEESIVMVNGVNDSAFPFEIFLKSGVAKNIYPVELKEWPNYTNIEDITTKTTYGCSTGKIMNNDSEPYITKRKGKRYFSIGVKLKDNILSILKTKFSLNSDKIFRILLMPIFVTLSDIHDNINILYPTQYQDIDRLDFVLFSSTTSENHSCISYKIKILSNGTELISGTSFGEFSSNGIWTEQYSPFKFFFTENTGVTGIVNKVPVYDGKNKGIGANTNSANILIEINDILSKKIEEYSDITLEVYANNGFKDTGEQ